MPRTIKAEDCIGLLNNCRTAQMLVDAPFSKNDFATIWKNCKLPWSQEVIASCIKFGLITRIAKGEYKFCVLKDDKCNIKRLENILNHIRATQKQYKAKSKANPKVKEAIDELKDTCNELTVEEPKEDKILKYISFLKENGYKVFKPTTITIYEEV